MGLGVAAQKVMDELQKSKYTISPERLKEFERRKAVDGTDEDVYIWLARQINMATPHELTALYLIRSDEKQHRAMELAMAANEAMWTRRAVYAALGTSAVATIISVVALVFG